MEEITDAELIALARAGQKDAFGRLVARYQEMARRIAQRVVANEDIARELAQEAMLQAYLSLDNLRDDARFKSWLYGIVLNVCRSFIRDQKIVFLSLETLSGGSHFDAVLFASGIPDPQELIEERELYHLILKAVNTLTPNERDATILFYYDQLSVREVAAVLGISPGAVKVRLHRARNQLREQLDLTMTERVSREERRKAMVQVSIVDVVKQEHKDEQQDRMHTAHVVVLYDAIGHRALPIWVGPFEGMAIAMGLGETTTARPMTYNFIASLLQAANAQVEEVRIETLKETTFYAIVKIRTGTTTREVDARPSDAIALALRTGNPIYATEDVLDKGGVAIPKELGKPAQLRQGTDSILKEFTETMRTVQTQARPQPTSEEIEKAKRELIATVFGSTT